MCGFTVGFWYSTRKLASGQRFNPKKVHLHVHVDLMRHDREPAPNAV
jgi:hypothetical protein